MKRWHGAVVALAAVLAVWAVGYAHYWRERTPRVVDWHDAFDDALGDFLMLGWVSEYQTLVAGFLTFAAGAFVWFAYRRQRNDALKDLRTAEEAQLLQALLTMRRLWLSARITLQTNRDLQTVLTAFTTIDAHIATLPVTASKLAITTQIVTGFAIVHVAMMIDGKDEENRDEAIRQLKIMTFAMDAFLRPHDRLVSNGRYIHLRRRLETEELDEAKELGILDGGKGLGFVDDLLIWDQT